MKKKIRQLFKMAVQNLVLPLAYCVCCVQKVRPGTVILADGHSKARPQRMNCLFEALEKNGYEVTEWYRDFQDMSYGRALLSMLQFMKLYAAANFVVISDNFLPAASCRKRRKTWVIQLWHGCGAFKKFGYDTEDDIPKDYVGNVFRNYDLVPVSGPASVPAFSSAMRLKKGVCRPMGVSATDPYFDEAYTLACREEFYACCPEARGKKVLLWAPTFRGNPQSPSVPGISGMEALGSQLGEEWFVIIKYHPHMEEKGYVSTVSLPGEKLLPVTDLLVTDYSSIVFNYSIYLRPMIFFAPDLKDYMDKRGFYLDYRTLPGRIVEREEELPGAVRSSLEQFDPEPVRQFREKYMGGCDGRATKRLIRWMDKRKLAKG